MQTSILGQAAGLRTDLSVVSWFEPKAMCARRGCFSRQAKAAEVIG